MVRLWFMRELEEEEGGVFGRRRYFRETEDAFNVSDGEFKGLFCLSKVLARDFIEFLADVISKKILIAFGRN